jgi:hypothetical protein
MQESDSNTLTKSKLKPYFKDSCFSGFDAKDPKNFYKVYD